jgi:hypothetical protein
VFIEIGEGKNGKGTVRKGRVILVNYRPLSFAKIDASSVNILIASVTLLPWRRYAPSECF